jgi:hypothetical protein
MADIVLKTEEEYNEEVRDLSLSQFRRDKYFAKLAGFNEQLEEAEVVIQQLFNERNIDTAIGAQLDVVGRIVNEDR